LQIRDIGLNKNFTMKILKTNWLNILGVFIILLIYSIIFNFTLQDNVTRTFSQSVFAALFLICLYGFVFWTAFIVALIILDFVIIIPNQNNLKLKLLIEWIIISSPFIYWAIKYSEQRNFYLVAIITFLITQLFRERLIKKLKNN
ncbi:hypothetical protein, partial [Elizabethkingia anophelis]|uniref:hypothetical protein n=2 Tax=Elizabethkingia anophelis TaxID=1117645 RepID=UPI001C87ABA6